MGGLHSIKGNKVSFSKAVLPFKKKWKKYALRQVVILGDAWTQYWLDGKRHRYLSCSSITEIAPSCSVLLQWRKTQTPSKGVPPLKAFHSSGHSSAGKSGAVVPRGARQTCAKAQCMSNTAEVVWIRCSQGRLEQAWRPPRTKHYTHKKIKKQEEKQTKSLDSFQRKPRVTLKRIAGKSVVVKRPINQYCLKPWEYGKKLINTVVLAVCVQQKTLLFYRNQ